MNNASISSVIRRVIVGGLLRRADGKVLLIKMPDNYGSYPGQWGLVGGGVDEEERIEEALLREIKEEIGLVPHNLAPFAFGDDVVFKKTRDGSEQKQHLIFLVFDGEVDGEPQLNDEWEQHEWVAVEDLKNYDLNPPTRKRFSEKGWL